MIDTSLLYKPWEEYDNRKWLADEDRNIFCPDDPWELNYLVDRVRQCYPEFDQVAVILAIRKTTNVLSPPRKRKVFLKYVMDILMENNTHKEL